MLKKGSGNLQLKLMVHLGHALTVDKHKLCSPENFWFHYLKSSIKKKAHTIFYNKQKLDFVTVALSTLYFSVFLTEGSLNIWEKKIKKNNLRDNLVLIVPK